MVLCLFKSESPCLLEIRIEIVIDNTIRLTHFKVMQGCGQVGRGTYANTFYMS